MLPLRVHAWNGFIAASAGGVLAIGVITLSGPREESRTRIPKAGRLAQAEVLLLGDSKLGALPEETLAIPAVNLASGGTAYRSQAALFKYYQPRMARLRTLLLDFDDLPLRNPDLERRNGDFSDLTDLGLPWQLLPVPWHQSITFAIAYRSLLKPLFVRRRSLQEWLGDVVNRSSSPLARGDQPQGGEARDGEKVSRVATGFSFAPAAGSAKMRGYRQLYRNEAVYRQNSLALAEILALADLHHIEVVLLRVPTTPAFGRARGEVWNRELQAVLQAMRQRFPSLQLSLWVVENPARFPLEAFHDPNHLNPAGYRIYAEYLNHRLRQRPVPDDSEQFGGDGDPNWRAAGDPREVEEAGAAAGNE